MQPADGKVEGPSALAQIFETSGVIEALVCVVTALAYLNTLTFGFVYDDKPAILDNVVIRSWRFLGHYFIPQISADIAPSASATFYRPMTDLWMRLNYATFGPNPAGWHFSMLAAHVLATYLVFAVVRKLTGNRATAGVAAILFGLHPVHVENVAWLSSVNDLLMTVFLLASFFAYLEFRDGKKSGLAISLLWFGLALLSKETTAAFPAVIFAFAAIFAGASTGEHAGKNEPVWQAGLALKKGLICLPYFMVLAAYLAARRLMFHGLAQPIASLSWSTMLLTWPSILWFDLKHLLLPVSSSEFYSLGYVTAPGFTSFLLPVGLLAVAAAVAAYWISKLTDRRLGAFALGWTILTILPTLYLRAIASGNFVHDRFLYLPSVGVVILLALAVEQLSAPKKPGKSGVPLKYVVVAILCTAAFAGTVDHQAQWANNLALYQNAIQYAPRNPVVQVNLANELANLGRYEQALPLYLSAVERDPRFWLSNYNLGYAYYKTAKYSEAENYLQRAIQIDDKDPDQFIYLAVSQMQQGKLQQAEASAEQALQRGPRSPGFHFVLAKILEASGNRERAIAEYQAEASQHPENAQARNELQRLQSAP